MIRTIFSEYLYANFCYINLTNLKKHMMQARKKDPKGRNVSNLGGWQSKSLEEVNKHNKNLFSIIQNEIEKLIKDLSFKGKLTLENYWYNINKKASYNAPHVHAGSSVVISGVFYVETPKNSGNIIFERTDNCIKNLYWDKGVELIKLIIIIQVDL